MPANIINNEICNTEPATGIALPPIPVASAEEVDKAVAAAHRAQARWAKTDFATRRDVMTRFRHLLNDRTEEVAELISRETGKPQIESVMHEVVPIIDLTHYFASRAHKFLADRPVRHHTLWPFKKGYVRYEPRGVIGIISPWNFPFTLAMGDVVMSLMAGNAVVCKPSEWTPRVLLKGRELLVAAGLDPDLFAVVPGGGDTGAALCQGNIQMMVFTGSVATGKKVGAICGEKLIPFVAELGGKDAAVILPDVDVDRAALQVVHGAFLNSGQTCASIERLLVHAAIYDQFVEAVVKHTRSLRQGRPDEEVEVGAMVMPSQVEKVRAHVTDALAKGARALTGGEAFGEGGARFFQPTVLVDVTNDMNCWTDETFGPTLPIRAFETVDEAVEIANETEYGLNAYVFSGSVGRAEDLANRLEAGGVIVNDFFYHHGLPSAPWGGWKNSGVGRVHGGEDGLRHLCEQRFVGLPRSTPPLPYTFPYTAKRASFWTDTIRKFYRSPVSRLS